MCVPRAIKIWIYTKVMFLNVLTHTLVGIELFSPHNPHPPQPQG